MFTDFFKISSAYFEQNLKYFNDTNDIIKKSQEILYNFIDYTKEYCSKLSKLYPEKQPIFEDYEIIEEYCLLKDNNDTIVKKPIDNIVKILHNFFSELGKDLFDFIKNLDNYKKGMDQYLEITKIEISSLKKGYKSDAEFYQSKFDEYQKLNEELKNNYYDAEKMLIQFCYERRIDSLPYDITFSLTNSDVIKRQNKIINDFHSLGNFQKEFLDITKGKIKIIQELTVTLLLKFENLSKNIPNLFNSFVLPPMNKLMEEITKSSQNESLELTLKKDFDVLSNQYMKDIDENNIKLKFDEYNLKSLENENIKINEIINEAKLKEIEKSKKKEKNSENISSDEVIKLTEKEIFFITQNMYQQFEFINKKNYDLQIEEKKLELGTIVKKLLNYSNKNSNSNKLNETKVNGQKNNGKNKNSESAEITKEEVNLLCKEMSNFEFRKYFLMTINQFRARDNLEMPNKIFDYISQIFKEISKYLYSYDEKAAKNGKINDLNCLRLVLILSQTFYTTINNDKKYLSDNLKKEKIFNFPELWKELICFNIDEESNKFFESLNKSNPTNDKNKINKYKDEIYFSQIIPLIGSMKALGKNIGEIKNIINFLIKKYDIPDKTSLTIFGAMEY